MDAAEDLQLTCCLATCGCVASGVVGGLAASHGAPPAISTTNRSGFSAPCGWHVTSLGIVHIRHGAACKGKAGYLQLTCCLAACFLGASCTGSPCSGSTALVAGCLPGPTSTTKRSRLSAPWPNEAFAAGFCAVFCWGRGRHDCADPMTQMPL